MEAYLATATEDQRRPGLDRVKVVSQLQLITFSKLKEPFKAPEVENRRVIFKSMKTCPAVRVILPS